LSGLLALAWPDSAKNYHALPSLRPGESDWQTLLQGVAHLYQQGAAIDWAAFDEDYPRQRTVVPTYPFQRKRYWVEATVKQPSKQVRQSSVIEAIDRGDTGDLLALIKRQGALTDAQQAFLPELLTRLVDLHQAPLLDSYYYRQDWRLKPLEQSGAGRPDGFWLIFAAHGGLAEDLARRLDELNQPSALVYAEEQFRTLPDGKGWSVNPEHSTDFDRLLSQLPAPVSRVVYLWGMQTKPVAELDADALNVQLRLGCQAALVLLQTFLKHFADSPKVCLVTQNAVAAVAEDTLSGLAQAPLWGFAKSWALEYPDAWDAIIDLPFADTGQSAEILTEELLRRDNEEFIAYRNGRRYGARLVRYPPEAKQDESFSVKADASYLITGGLGALGLHVAQWLVEQGAKQLVLVGRSAPSEAVNRIVEAMRQADVDVKIESADVADFAAMSALFAAIAARDRLPLRGIIHAAGTFGFTKMDALSSEQLQAIIRPKVQGGWILHGLSLATELDFFICFSSIASLWGAKGQAHYAAANHFLDGLAHYRRHLGLPGLSLNWGPWSEGGMATEEAQRFLQQQGIETLPPQTMLAALTQLITSAVAQVSVAKIDWPVFVELYQLQKKHLLLEDFSGEQGRADNKPDASVPSLKEQWQSLAETEREPVLRRYLQEKLTAILKLDYDDWSGLEQGFFQMGVDSLMAIELKNQLAADFKTLLPATLIFDYPTLQKLADYLSDEVLQWRQVKAQPETAVAIDQADADIATRINKLENLINSL
jgi:acyl transferase domain-containing protein/acyl carrier protein